MAHVKALTLIERPAECCSPLAGSHMSAAEAETTAAAFKALADPSRVRIVNLLATAGQPLCVCDVTEEVGLSQPTVSFHLKKLVAAGLLERERRGVWAFYSLNRGAFGRMRTVFRMEGASR